MQTNQQLGREVVQAVGYVGDVARFMMAADIVMGIGRCAFEAMAIQKPTLIVGNLGFAGTVCEETVDQLAYYNFAGRNIVEVCPAVKLCDELDDLLSNPMQRNALGPFCRKYVLENLSAARGAEQLEHVLLNEMAVPSRSAAERLRVWALYLLYGSKYLARGLLANPKLAASELARISRVRHSCPQYCLVKTSLAGK